MTTQEVGAWGEAEAVRFLTQRGYDIVTRNFQVREGEIDVIAWHVKPHFGKTLCFIEVKTRSGERGSAERAVSQGGKLGRMQRAAVAYCLQSGIERDVTPIQFEQISIYGSPRGLNDIRQYDIPL